MKFLLLFLIAALPIIAQPKFDFNSPDNIKLFADHLFCERDYLRSAEEYMRLDKNFCSDTILFKTGLGFYYIGDFSKSGDIFNQIPVGSVLYEDANFQKNLLSFLKNPEDFHSTYHYDQYIQKPDKFNINSCKLAMISSLLDSKLKISEEEFFQPFNSEEKKQLKKYLEWKNDPPFKSSALAGILSTIIPGAGKIYTEEYGDGIVAFLTTGLLTFLAYDNFKADHKIRAWIFTSLAGLFYSGNIYGSFASAQIYNAKISFEFKDGINIWLEKNNYFGSEYDFCK
jgi:TM2 domain-containing membrane protein YozV